MADPPTSEENQFALRQLQNRTSGDNHLTFTCKFVGIEIFQLLSTTISLICCILVTFWRVWNVHKKARKFLASNWAISGGKLPGRFRVTSCAAWATTRLKYKPKLIQHMFSCLNMPPCTWFVFQPCSWPRHSKREICGISCHRFKHAKMLQECNESVK